MIASAKNHRTGKPNYKPEMKIIEKKKNDAVDNLRTRFFEKLKTLYWAEKAMIKAIPVMKRNAKSEELVEALEFQRMVGGEQILRLEAIFTLFNSVPETRSNDVIQSLIKETEKVLHSNKGMVRDAEAIALIQQIQHLEIALYGTLCSFARILGEEIVLLLLEDSLSEEKQADKNLSIVAEVFVNPVAAYGYPIRVAANGTEDLFLINLNSD
jgi:ferritin-like metal-binding protein YciE